MIFIPAAITALTAWLTLRSVHQKELKKQMLELKFRSQEVITPIRLQAYERTALLLERMKPESLLLRHTGSQLTVNSYRHILLTSIRNEFEHNLSQQVYVSAALWDAVREAKEETVRMIHAAAGKLLAEASGNDLAQAILEINVRTIPQPSDRALAVLKEEIKNMY
jgi:hypothetical protein